MSIHALRRLLEARAYGQLAMRAEAAWRDSPSPDLLPLLALSNALSGNETQAASWYAECERAQDRFDLLATADFALALIARRDLACAERVLAPKVSPSCDSEVALRRLAWIKEVLHGPQAALSWLERAAELTPGDRFISYKLVVLKARVLIDKGQFESAEALLQDAMGVPKLTTEAERSVLFARILAEHDQHELAEQHLHSMLSKAPDNQELLLMLGELAGANGQDIVALGAFRRLCQLAPRESRYFSERARVAARVSLKEARDAAEQALALASDQFEPDVPPYPRLPLELEPRPLTALDQARLALAQVEDASGNAARAIFHCEDVLKQSSDCLPALKLLASLKLQLGEIEQAVQILEKVRKLDPISGHFGLMTARHFPEDQQTLETLEFTARQPSLNGSVDASMLLRLASAWERQGNYQRAFSLAHEANQFIRERLPYDPVQHRQACARIRFGFQESLYRARAGLGHDSRLPLYIVGMPRSGTTLLEQILASHSKIFGAGELGIVPSLIQGLNRWERRVGSGRAFPDCVDDLSPEVCRGLAEQVLRGLTTLARDSKPAATYVADKLPHNFLYLGFIKFLFPNARVISVRRDPRDIAISNYFTDYQAKFRGMGFAYDLTEIGEQLADHNLMMDHWHSLFPGEIFELCYEDLVRDPVPTLKDLLAYLGLPFEPAMLAFQQLPRAVKTASVWQVRQPLYQSSQGRWRHYEKHLKPLLRGTNSLIRANPIDDMASLPEPGLLERVSAHYHAGRLDDAEYEAKKLLHHLPGHGAAQYFLGAIYYQKGAGEAALELMEAALERCPWNEDWRRGYEEACRLCGIDVPRVQAHENARAAEHRSIGARFITDYETTA